MPDPHPRGCRRSPRRPARREEGHTVSTDIQPIEIESIARLEIKAGETLVVNLGRNRRVDHDEAKRITDVLRQKLPAGVEVLITYGDIELKIIAREDA
jgi:hypothetical protein